jgi:hypothetical protein
MSRTRSVLIDNTLGRIFRGVTSVVAATPANLIAGSKIETTSIAAGRRITTRVTNNLAGASGIFFPGGALINSVVLTAAAAPAGTPIVLHVKTGTNYSTASDVAEYQLSSTTATFSTLITVPAGNSVFFDITQVGSVRPGAGFGVRINYFRG